MSAAALTRDLVVSQTRALKLPGVARTFERLAREARFHEVKTLDQFDFGAIEGVTATPIHTLARGQWVTAPENLIFAGPIGTGKTHLAIALGVEATRQKRRVLFTRAADLVRQLLEARDARELTRLQQRLLRVEVLVVDELGVVSFDRVGGERLFNLLTDRCERWTTVLTTNLPFADWVTVFAGDEKPTTALLDRLAHHAVVITTKGLTPAASGRVESTPFRWSTFRAANWSGFRAARAPRRPVDACERSRRLVIERSG